MRFRLVAPVLAVALLAAGNYPPETNAPTIPAVVFVDPVFISVIWVGLGDTKKAMHYLEDAYRVQSSFLWYWLADPVFDRLRSDLRFKELQRRMNLPSNRDRGRN